MDSGDRFTAVLQHGRREAILSAFAQAVVELGYAQVTMGEVASRAGLPVGDVRELFPARPDLVAGLIERNTVAARARIEAARRETAGIEPWTERVRLLLRGYLEAMAHDPAYVRIAIVEPNALDDVDPKVKIGMRDGYVTSTLAISREIAAQSGLVPLDETNVYFVSAGMSELVARNIYAGMAPADAMLAIIDPTVRVLELLMPPVPVPAPARTESALATRCRRRPTVGRIGRDYRAESGPVSRRPIVGRIGRGYRVESGPVSRRPIVGRIGRGYRVEFGPVSRRPIVGRIGRDYRAESGPVSRRPIVGRIGRDYRVESGPTSQRGWTATRREQ